jgi:hypothetical protein
MSEPFMPLFHVHPFLQTKTPIHLPHGKERKFPLELQEKKKDAARFMFRKKRSNQ